MKLGFPAVAVGSLAIVAGLLLLLYERPPESGDEELIILCAAGLRPPVDAIIGDYQREYPRVHITVQPSGSGQLLTNVMQGQRGDLFLAADASFVDIAHEKGFVAERLPVAVLTPVLAVKKGNEARVTSLRSLLDKDLRVGLGNPGGPAIGDVTKKMLTKAGLWPQVEAAVQTRGVFKPTVTDLANDLKLGTIDVAILFDGTLSTYPELAAIPIPTEISIQQRATIGVVSASQHPTRALHFARYLAARDKGLPHFTSHGYVAADGDDWSDRPTIRFLCGGMMRPNVEETIRAFEQREGVQVDRNFNGCGILVGALKAGDAADAYFACDTSFLDQVQDLFLDGLPIARTRMVIAVPKGNPAGVQSLSDLGRDGLHVGVANAQQSTLGALTENLLRQNGLYDQVMSNVRVQVPTADLLIAHLLGKHVPGKHLDAAIVYEVNARRVPHDVEVLDLPQAVTPAVQPVAIAKQSRYKHLVGRLVEALARDDSRRRFEADGFEWLSPRPAAPVDKPTASVGKSAPQQP